MIDVFTQQIDVVMNFQRCRERSNMRKPRGDNAFSVGSQTRIVRESDFTEDLLQDIMKRKAELVTLQNSTVRIFEDVRLIVSILSSLFLV